MASRKINRSRKRRKNTSFVLRRRVISAETQSVADYMLDKARDVFKIGVLGDDSLSEDEKLQSGNWVSYNSV